MVHGYECSEAIAASGYCEAFKRMYWSGSRARYHAVSWYSDYPTWSSTIQDLFYQQNALNGFTTASNLSVYVNGLGGDVTIAAHSQGNILVSSAIQDEGMNVENYFMISAAVASEAFDPASYDAATMVHPYWTCYSNRLWSACWHELFAPWPGDERNELTWADRFPLAAAKGYNFYSPGDHILEVTNAVPSVATAYHFKAQYSWWTQELMKGRLLVPLGTSTYGGWGWPVYPQYHHWWGALYTNAEMDAVSDADLRANPFFCSGMSGAWSPTGISTLYDAGTGTGSPGSGYAYTNGNQLIVEMIPALSRPAGTVGMPTLTSPSGSPRNFDMQSLRNGWPLSRDPGSPWKSRWKHRDFRDIGYVHVHEVFDKFVKEGNLK